MSKYSLKHLSDEDVVRGLESNAARHRETITKALAIVDELERRNLPVPVDPELIEEWREEIAGFAASEDEKSGDK